MHHLNCKEPTSCIAATFTTKLGNYTISLDMDDLSVMSYGSSGRSILRIAFFQPWPKDQLAVKHRNMKETLAVWQFEVCSYPPSREWEWENKVRTVSESHSLALWHHWLLMFFFLLVVMVPNMKRKTGMRRETCLKLEQMSWQDPLNLEIAWPSCEKASGLSAVKKRVPYGCVNGRWGQKWNTHFLMKTKLHLPRVKTSPFPWWSTPREKR